MKTIIIVLIAVFISLDVQSQVRYAYLPEGRTPFETSTEKIIIGTKNAQLPEALRLFISDPSVLNNLTSQKWNIFSLKSSHHNADSLIAILERLRTDTTLLYVNPVLKYKDGTLQGLTDQLIVRLKKTANIDSLSDLFQRLKINIVRKNQFVEREYLLSIKLQPHFDALDAANALYETGIFEYAEPNFVILNAYHYISKIGTDGTKKSINKTAPPKPFTGDAVYADQWGLENTGQYNGTSGADIKVNFAWPISTGSGITVAVIDEGVDLSHPDLSGNLGGGYDALFMGSAGAPSGSDAHGTACAGIIGATANNTIGIAGVAYDCTLIPVRAGIGGSFAQGDCATGISWAYSSGGGNADIISCSWGGGSTSSAINNAISDATTLGRGGLGSIVLFSTGNSNSSSVSYPSSLSNVIAVGGVNPCDGRFNFSPTTLSSDCNYDTRLATVNITAASNYGTGLGVVAPGINIATTDISGSAGFNTVTTSEGWVMFNNDYVLNFDGTSAACPFAAGTMALILAANPTLTRDQATAILESTADKAGGYSYSTTLANGTWNNEMGYGRINAFAAAQEAFLMSQAPASICSTFVFHVNLPAGASVSWSAIQTSTVGSLSAAGDSVTVTKVSDGDMILRAVVTYNSGNDSIIVTTPLLVGGPTLSFYIVPLWYSEDHTFCTNSFGNNFEIVSGALTNVTAFEWGISPSIVVDANGWLQELGVLFSTGGYYQIYARAKNACGYGSSGTATYDIYVDDNCSGLLATKNKSKNGNATPETASTFTIYPNPAGNTLYVTTPADIDIRHTLLRIIDVAGREVKRNISLLKGQTEVNIASLSKGNYFVEITDGKKKYTKKLIKK